MLQDCSIHGRLSSEWSISNKPTSEDSPAKFRRFDSNQTHVLSYQYTALRLLWNGSTRILRLESPRSGNPPHGCLKSLIRSASTNSHAAV